MNFEIELVKVGRNNVSRKLNVKNMSLEDAEQEALHQASLHLMSSIVELTRDRKKGNYTVIVGGMRPVGTVLIREKK